MKKIGCLPLTVCMLAAGFTGIVFFERGNMTFAAAAGVATLAFLFLGLRSIR